MEKPDTGLEVEVKTDEGATLVEVVRALQKRLREAFGTSGLTSRVKDEGASVIANSDGWQFTARGRRDGEVVFDLGEAVYRVVRPVERLNRVGREGDTIAFVFGDRELPPLGSGTGHRV